MKNIMIEDEIVIGLSPHGVSKDKKMMGKVVHPDLHVLLVVQCSALFHFLFLHKAVKIVPALFLILAELQLFPLNCICTVCT